MEVKLIAHTQLSCEFYNQVFLGSTYEGDISDGQAVALTAIRTCYSHNKPSEIVELEGEKYFGSVAKDGEGGTEADRLIRHIVRSGHLSTCEHISFTFAIEGVSRSLLAQLTRHRVGFSFSVQSQRYNKLETTSKSGGFDYVVPETVKEKGETDTFIEIMSDIQSNYDVLRKLGIPAEDARYILPNAATCNLVLTGNLRSILDFYSKRSAKGAQKEIRELAEHIKKAVVEVELWAESFFS
jgi:thymidylate synthase (FAD)